MVGGPQAEDVRSWNDCRATSNIPIPSREGSAMRRPSGDIRGRPATLRVGMPTSVSAPFRSTHTETYSPSGATPPGRYANVPFEATLNWAAPELPIVNGLFTSCMTSSTTPTGLPVTSSRVTSKGCASSVPMRA